MSLTPKQRQFLKGLAHKRKPVVMVGNAGLSAAVLAEIELALERHELLKVRLPAVDRAERAAMVKDMCEKTRALPVQEIGRVAVLFRHAEKPRIELPAL